MREHVITHKKLNKTRLNVYLDLLLMGVFLVDMEVQFSGLALHEALGLLFGIAFALHVVLHWDWVVSITRIFFKLLLHESRVNYVLNVLLFIDTISLTVSGILISRTLGLHFTLGQDVQELLHSLHLVGAELVLILVAIHVAMHWKWIRANTRYLFGWTVQISRKRRARQQF